MTIETLRKILTKFPRGIFSLLTLILILWLTLSPKPLGEKPPKLFEGADKIVHGLMFGFFAVMMIFDWQRKNGWRAAGFKIIICSALLSAMTGIGIEFCQDAMGKGRGYENADIFADTIGAFLFAFLWIPFQNKWLKGNSVNKDD